MNSPCLDCQLRKQGCHSECKAYREYREKKDAENAQHHHEATLLFNPHIEKLALLKQSYKRRHKQL